MKSIISSIMSCCHYPPTYIPRYLKTVDELLSGSREHISGTFGTP